MMSALTSNLTVQDQHRRNNALKNYFTAGFSYEEICNFLFRFHRIKITIRHLNRLLRQCNLQRRGNHSNINTVTKFIQDELKGSSLCFGYRYMLQKLRSSGLTADKETVRLMYIFIYSRIIEIKIKIYNNMQLKYKKNKTTT